jgi:G protein-coupled receptor 157
VYSDDLTSNYSSNITHADPLQDKKVWLRVVVAAVSLLSMTGAVLIILSYICISSIRTKSREILVHLSFADFGVACANFIGVIVDFDKYIRSCQLHEDTLSHVSCASHFKHLCETQAFFAGFSTIASILWTLALSVYIYLLVVHEHRKLHSKAVYFCYVLCWGLPLLISLWLVLTGRLGHSLHGGSGWCSLKLEQEKRSTGIYITVFGNDLWVYLTVVVVTLLYLTTHCHIKRKLQSSVTVHSKPQKSAVTSADMKFLLIPLAFLLLRCGSIVVVIVYIYAQAKTSNKVAYFLLCIAGIGDTGQGFVNAILFCLFTTKVREKLKVGVARLCHCHCLKSHSYTSLQYSTNSAFTSTSQAEKKVLMSENA